MSDPVELRSHVACLVQDRLPAEANPHMHAQERGATRVGLYTFGSVEPHPRTGIFARLTWSSMFATGLDVNHRGSPTL